jgi:homospermidine synthase
VTGVQTCALPIYFTKQALVDISERLIRDGKVSQREADRLHDLVRGSNFAELSMLLGIKVIHCSERDTQTALFPKQVNEFVGTWSIEGLREEGTAPAEIGWGTHESALPPLSYVPSFGPKNQIMLAQMGMNTWVRSWVPHGEIVGTARPSTDRPFIMLTCLAIARWPHCTS